MKKVYLATISVNEIFPIDGTNPIVFEDFSDDEENTVTKAIRKGNGSSVDMVENFAMSGNYLQMTNLFLSTETPSPGHYEIDVTVADPDGNTDSITIVQDVIC